MAIRREPSISAVKMWGYIAAALALGFVVPRVQERRLPWLLTHLSKDQVIAFLSSVSSGMMAFTGIIFSLLFVLLQFGSTEYTPRIVAILGRNRVLFSSGGVFAGTFIYTLMALRGVGDIGGERTGMLTILVAFAWLLASVFKLVRLFESLDDLTHTNVLFMLGDAGQREAERLYAPWTSAAATEATGAVAWPGAPAHVVVHRGSPRYVLAIEVEKLVALAERVDAVFRIPLAPGDAVTAGASLVIIHARGVLPEEKLLREAIRLGRERTIEQDPKYAIRLLVDIGIRALSPAVNDPTTAVQALDQIESLLAHLGNRILEIGQVRDSSGILRLAYEATTWEDYLDLAITEIQQYGSTSVQVERRLAALFRFLADQVPDLRRPAIEKLARRRALAPRSLRPPMLDAAALGMSDRQGLGHAERAPDGPDGFQAMGSGRSRDDRPTPPRP